MPRHAGAAPLQAQHHQCTCARVNPLHRSPPHARTLARTRRHHAAIVAVQLQVCRRHPSECRHHLEYVLLQQPRRRIVRPGQQASEQGGGVERASVRAAGPWQGQRVGGPLTHPVCKSKRPCLAHARLGPQTLCPVSGMPLSNAVSQFGIAAQWPISSTPNPMPNGPPSRPHSCSTSACMGVRCSGVGRSRCTADSSGITPRRGQPAAITRSLNVRHSCATVIRSGRACQGARQGQRGVVRAPPRVGASRHPAGLAEPPHGGSAKPLAYRAL